MDKLLSELLDIYYADRDIEAYYEADLKKKYDESVQADATSKKSELKDDISFEYYNMEPSREDTMLIDNSQMINELLETNTV